MKSRQETPPETAGGEPPETAGGADPALSDRQGASRTELAAALGVTESAIIKADRNDRLAPARLADGTFDVARARQVFPESRRNPPGPGRKRKPRRKQQKPTLWDLQAEHEKVKIAERRLKLRRQRNELVPGRPFRREVFALLRRERDAWLTWPSRIAARGAERLGLELGALQLFLEDEVRAQLRDMALRMPLADEDEEEDEPEEGPGARRAS